MGSARERNTKTSWPKFRSYKRSASTKGAKLRTPSRNRTSKQERRSLRKEKKATLSSLSLMVKLRQTKPAKHLPDLLTDTLPGSISVSSLSLRAHSVPPPSPLSLMLKLPPSSANASRDFWVLWRLF